jgi:putative transposase
MGERRAYPSDLTDGQWARLAPLVPAPSRRGRPRATDARRAVDGILYVLRTGCQWRYLPREYPPWQTVYWYFRRWQHDGTWERANDALRRRSRVAAGRRPEPTAAVIDSQSVKTTERGGRAASTPPSA